MPANYRARLRWAGADADRAVARRRDAAAAVEERRRLVVGLRAGKRLRGVGDPRVVQAGDEVADAQAALARGILINLNITSPVPRWAAGEAPRADIPAPLARGVALRVEFAPQHQVLHGTHHNVAKMFCPAMLSSTETKPDSRGRPKKRVAP